VRRPAFERLVSEILDELPEEFARKIENVEFVVEARPAFGDRKTLVLGIYQGIPRFVRSPTSYAGVLPDEIVIYHRNIEEEAGRPGRVREVLRHTILHEIAHHFGISDERLMELGVY
jgi:predicted Zn-dependent protease with MMP-like domain